VYGCRSKEVLEKYFLQKWQNRRGLVGLHCSGSLEKIVAFKVEDWFVLRNILG